MFRRLKIYGKKRGMRRTGSRLVGNLGELSFHVVLFLAGFTLLVALVTAQVINPTPQFYQFGFGFWLLVLVLSSGTLIGLVGLLLALLRIGASAERQSVLRSAARRDLIRDAKPAVENYPTVPSDRTVSDSPGVMLAYRLPNITTTTWKLLAWIGGCMVVAAFAASLSVVFAHSVQIGRPDWVVLIFASPYIAASCWTVYYFLKQIWHYGPIGPTCLEISEHPLRPGRHYRLFLSQAGRLHLSRIQLTLVCEEEATYQQGTDVRTERKIVATEEVFSRDDVTVAPKSPFEWEGILAVPESAMHTFQSSHNVVHWKLVVRVKPVKRPPFDRSYPVIIYPPAQHGHHPSSPIPPNHQRADRGALNQPADPKPAA